MSDDGNTLPHSNNVQPQSPSSGQGWTQRVKGWFSSVRFHLNETKQTNIQIKEKNREQYLKKKKKILLGN